MIPNVNVRGPVHNSAEDLIRRMGSASGPLSGLTVQQIAAIVAHHAPYGNRAREAFYSTIRDYVAKRVPTEYP